MFTVHMARLFTSIAIRGALEERNSARQVSSPNRAVPWTMARHAKDRHFRNRPCYTRFAWSVLDTDRTRSNNSFSSNIHYYSLHDMIFLGIPSLNRRSTCTTARTCRWPCLGRSFTVLPVTRHWSPTSVNRPWESIAEHDLAEACVDRIDRREFDYG